MGHPVPISGPRVAAAVEAETRDMVLAVVAVLLAAAPGVRRAFASKHPDQWAEAIATLVELTGHFGESDRH